MDEDLAEYALSLAEKKGCDWAEARLESATSFSLVMRNSVFQIGASSSYQGIGIRVLVNGSMGFSSTNILSRKSIASAVSKAARLSRLSTKIAEDSSLSNEKTGKASCAVRQKEKLQDTSPEEKTELLKEIDAALAGSKANVKGRFFSYSDAVQEKYVANTDGASVKSVIPRLNIFYVLTIRQGRKSTQRYWEKGSSSGFEAVKKWDLAETLARECEVLSANLRRGRRLKKGVLDVVVGPEIAGIMAHESCGHPFEADRVLGREAAQAGESFVTPETIGKKVASSAVSLCDWPVVANSYGYYLYDDEGVKARKTWLIKEGVAASLLHNRETASAVGTRSTGHARASSFDREPLVRMSNTFFAKGEMSEEELLEGVKKGVYIRNFNEWNIDDKRMNARYVGAEAYLIRNGSIDEPVVNPVLEISTPALYTSIDAAAKNLELHAGECGKGEPMQGMPVTFGGPSLRLRKVSFR